MTQDFAQQRVSLSCVSAIVHFSFHFLAPAGGDGTREGRHYISHMLSCDV
jgi:hypothetical protein